ncbi:MAG: methyltransferase domain-containing protein [Bacteroidota bacterium]|nr:methyltransferase domain-containing protein [Bacteroidota bacterium]
MKGFRNTAIYLFILLSVSCCTGLKTVNGYIGFFCKTPEVATKLYADRIKFYELQKNETVVSIGADNCTNEAVYGSSTDSVHFILENISAKYLNQKQLDFTVGYYEKLFQKKNAGTYTIQIGNESSTLLPSSSADKVLIENSFHEFSEPQNMLKEVYRILKNGGSLYLCEALVTEKRTIHKGCGMPLYTKEKLIEAVKKENFHFVSISETQKAPLLKFSKE